MGLKDSVHGILDWFEAEWKNVKGSPELSEDEKDLAAKLRSQLVDLAHTGEADAKDDVATVEADVNTATEAAPAAPEEAATPSPVAQVVSDASGNAAQPGQPA
jgi:hypothetical protein